MQEDPRSTPKTSNSKQTLQSLGRRHTGDRQCYECPVSEATRQELAAQPGLSRGTGDHKGGAVPWDWNHRDQPQGEMLPEIPWVLPSSLPPGNQRVGVGWEMCSPQDRVERARGCT